MQNEQILYPTNTHSVPFSGAFCCARTRLINGADGVFAYPGFLAAVTFAPKPPARQVARLKNYD